MESAQQSDSQIDSHNRVDVDVTTKVSGKITEMGTLLDDWSHVDGLVPPSGFGDSLVGTRLLSALL